jgi:transcriptional regulator with XRE-family HTH domain
MLDAHQVGRIRNALGLSQEQMARLLGVSFASVNRWEGGHSAPTGSVLDIYLALEAALRNGNQALAIIRASNNERGVFLYTLFRMAYGPAKRRA